MKMATHTTEILFDVNPLVGNKSGVGHFTNRLLASLAATDKDIHITAYYFNFLGRKKGFTLPKHKNITYRVVRFCPTKLLSILNILRIRLPIELFVGLRRYNFAVYPNFVSMPSIRKIPSLVAVHDLGFLDCPEYVQDANRRYLERSVPSSIARSAYVLTISDFTKSRIAHHYGVGALNKAIVVPIPYEPNTELHGEISEGIRSSTAKPYILYVGTIEPRKNIDNLILAFLESTASQTHRLVLAGGMGWKTEKIEKVLRESADKADIVTTGYVSDAERDYLYKNCKAVCLVSHYEGFGMQILETFHYKKPILLSSIDVFHEVAGDVAVFCDPETVSSIADGIDSTLTKTVATKYPKTLSWEKIVVGILEKIQEVV